MLLHSCKQRNIIILDPTSEGMEQKKRVLVAKLKKLLSCIFQQKHVAIMKRISKLEGIDCICISLLN